MAQELPLLGIRRCYLALYENPQVPTEQARLILAYDEQGRVALPPGGLVFPSRKLLPQELWRPDQSYNLFVEALSFQEQQLGFVLFEAASREEWIFETLRGQLSSSLKGALLVEQARAAAEQARAAAEAANAAKSIFLANMSHELRTPLNGILGFAQILLRKRMEADAMNGLSIIRQSGEHLLTLINDILDLAKIEAGKLELAPTPLHLPSLLNGIVGIIRARAEAKQLSVAFETLPNLPAWIEVDQTRLRQVLLNLLGNAVKFTDRGSVTLRVTTGDHRAGKEIGRQGDRHDINLAISPSPILPFSQPSVVGGRSSVVVFEVTDTGPGIAPEQLERIFQPFEQAGELRRQVEGTGLGLAISRQLVRLMGGELHVESELGRGSSFWFAVSLPLAAGAGRTVPAQERLITGYRARRRTVLVVDDVASNRAVLADMLQPLGFAVLEA